MFDIHAFYEEVGELSDGDGYPSNVPSFLIPQGNINHFNSIFLINYIQLSYSTRIGASILQRPHTVSSVEAGPNYCSHTLTKCYSSLSSATKAC